MCFTIPGTQLIAKKATKDIPCIKIVYPSNSKKGSYKAQYRRFYYDEGFEYSNDNFKKKSSDYPNQWNNNKRGTREGIHSYFLNKNGKYYYVPYGAVELECYIPKGAYYFSNRRTSEYFSDRLVVPEQKG